MVRSSPLELVVGALDDGRGLGSAPLCTVGVVALPESNFYGRFGVGWRRLSMGVMSCNPMGSYAVARFR